MQAQDILNQNLLFNKIPKWFGWIKVRDSAGVAPRSSSGGWAPEAGVGEARPGRTAWGTFQTWDPRASSWAMWSSSCRQSKGSCFLAGLGGAAALWRPTWYGVTQSGKQKRFFLSRDKHVKHPEVALQRSVCSSEAHGVLSHGGRWRPHVALGGTTGVRLGKDSARGRSGLVNTGKEGAGRWVF